MSEQSAAKRWLDLGLLVLLLSLGLVSFHRASRGRYDFHHFYLDARYVWEHRQINSDSTNVDPDRRRQLPFYLPVVPLLLAPLAGLGRLGAALVWSAVQVAALGFSLRLLWQWAGLAADHESASNLTGLPRQQKLRVGIFAVAVLLALPALLEAAKFNQLSYFVLVLVLGAAWALDRGRPAVAGIFLGVATALKLLPAIFLPWLLLKRQWVAAATLVAAAAGLALLPPLLVFGPPKTLEYHRQWWDYNVRGQAAQGLLDQELPEHFIDRRNQSIPQVLARLTWPQHPHAVAFQPLRLDQPSCVALAYGLAVILFALLAWTTRRPWERLTLDQRHAEAAAYAIGMLVFSPLLRQYYLVWAVPGLVLLARLASGGVPTAASARRWSSRRLGWAGLAIWAGGMLAWIWPTARLLGAHLIMLIALGATLLYATARVKPSAENRPLPPQA